MSIRIGIIGAGSIGKVHALALKKAGQMVCTVADRVLSRAEKLAGEVGTDATADVDSVIADPALDGVYVCVPNCWHRDLAIAALTAGKDVFLEKPMGLSAHECREINAVAKAHDRLVQVGMAYRYATVSSKARSLVESGALGEVYHAKAHLYRQRGVPGLGGWFTTKSKSGGGPLIDLGVHLIDLVEWLVGFPTVQRVSGKVYAHFGKRMGGYVYDHMWAGPPRLDGVCDVEDSAHAMVRYDGGLTLDLQTSWAINYPAKNFSEKGTIALCGDRGGLSFELMGDSLSVVTESGKRFVESKRIVAANEPFVDQAREFARCVTTRSTPPSTGAQAQQVQTVIDAIYESSEMGQEVEL